MARGFQPGAAGRRRGTAAFTLIEVVLAILISLGLLVGVLQFHSHATDLRRQLLTETERMAAVRLLMDRLTADLRSAHSDFALGLGLTGDASSLSVLSAAAPSPAIWRSATLGRSAPVESDLRRIRYGVTTVVDETNVVITGFTREETPLAAPRQTEEILAETFDALMWGEAELPVERPLTEAIRFVRFRYWDGSSWQEAWSSSELPRGVEVSFGSEPLPEELVPEEYPYELFRRVIYLPGSGLVDDLSWLEVLEDFAPVDEEGAEPGLEELMEELP